MRKLFLLNVSLLLSVFLPADASAQRISIGVKGGVPVTSPSASHDESRRYVVGPSIEIHLPANFAVEGAALYQRVGSENTAAVITPGASTVPLTSLYSFRYRGNRWEFPVLGKYYFRSQRSSWQPYIGTGYSFATTWLRYDYSYPDSVTGKAISGHTDGRSPTNVGAIFAAGVRLHAGRLAVLPELRYSRWGGADPVMRKNQLTAFLGIQF